MPIRRQFVSWTLAVVTAVGATAFAGSAYAQSAPPPPHRGGQSQQQQPPPPPPDKDSNRADQNRGADQGRDQSRDRGRFAGPGTGFGRDHGFGRGPMRPGPHAGDWLRKFKDLSPAEQEKSLNNDPHFQQLPPDHQERLRERLKQFNSLPPDQKQRMVDRMEKWESLTPLQRERVRGFQDKLHQMPEDRQNTVRKAIRSLVESSPEERKQTLNSSNFKSSFNDDEREVIQGMIEIEDTPGPPKFDF